MTRVEKIELLKKYKEFLIYLNSYKTDKTINQKQTESKEHQKVFVLKKSFYGKSLNVA